MEDLRESLAAYEVCRPQPPEGLSFEEFLRWGDEDTWAEWVDGEVIVLAPASAPHQKVKGFLCAVMRECAHHHHSGAVLDAPFPVRLPERLRRGREPDILFVRREQLPHLKETYFDGSPDVIVEIVSPESRIRDYKIKYTEYEAAGVGEYWLVEPNLRQVIFYRLGTDGRFHPETPDEQGIFRSEAFPGFWLNVGWLWQDPLPSVEDINLQDSGGYSCVYGKGKRDGKLEGKREAARQFLATRFGGQSADIQETMKELTDLNTLNYVLRELFLVNGLEEARNVLNNGLRHQNLLEKDE